MSKLAKAIKAKQHGRVAIAEPMRLTTVDSGIAELSIEDAYCYSIGVIFEVRARCKRSELGHIQRTARRAIIEEILGEFRPAIMRIYESLCDRDYDQAMKAVADLENQMFSIEGAAEIEKG